MTPPDKPVSKSSTALLVVWFLVIAGLVGAIVYLTLVAQAPPPADPAVKPIPGGTTGGRTPPKSGKTPRHPDRPEMPTPGPMPRQLLIEGIVRGPNNNPVGGAHVTLFPHVKTGPASADTANKDELLALNSMIYIQTDEWDQPRPLQHWSSPASESMRPADLEIAAADSGEDGTFSIRIPPTVGSGPFRLTASKDGIGSAALASVTAGQKVDIVLGTAMTVKGVVLTEVQSAAVPSAHVSIDNGSRRFAAVTDDKGQFEMPGVTPGTYQITVGAKDLTPLFETRRLMGAEAGQLTLRMPRGTTLRVKAVLDRMDTAPGHGAPDGEPIAGAQVVIYNEENMAYLFGTTRQDGTVEFPSLPAGKWIVNGKAKDVISSGEQMVSISGNEQSQEETLSFEPAVLTPIEVVDEEGRAVADVVFYSGNVDEKYDSLLSMKLGATDGDGKLKFPFEFDGPRCAIYGFKTGYSCVRACPAAYDEGEPLRLVAKKALHVQGTVKTTDGRPIPDAAILITVTASDPAVMDDVEFALHCGPDGTYDFPYLPSGESIMISATAPDGVSTDDVDLELSEGKSSYVQDLVIDLGESDTPAPPPGPTPRQRIPGTSPHPVPPDTKDKGPADEPK